jgi:hypothetical protein
MRLQKQPNFIIWFYVNNRKISGISPASTGQFYFRPKRRLGQNLIPYLLASKLDTPSLSASSDNFVKCVTCRLLYLTNGFAQIRTNELLIEFVRKIAF